MDITAANLDILFKQVSNLYQSALVGTPKYYDQIASVFPMATRQQTMAFLDRLPVMRKWHGERIINNAFAHSRSVIAEPYEDTFSIDVFDLADEQTTVFGFGVQQFGEAMAKWQDTMLSDFITGQAATVLGYDGVPVYSTAHPLLGGVTGGIPGGAPITQSNLAVSTALTYANYIDVWQRMAAWVGADGKPMGVTPNVLMVPPQLAGTAKLILESDFLAAGDLTSTSNASQTNVWKNSTKLLVNPWLSSMPNNWWLLDTSSALKPFAVWQREAPTMAALTSPTDPNVFMNHQFVWGAQARGAATETVWWLSYAATSEAQYYAA